jgi:hypothetical protein
MSGFKLQQLIFAAFSFLLVSCAHRTELTFPDCKLSDECTISGKLTMFPYTEGQAAWIETARGCVALALPGKVYLHMDQWKDRSVYARGTLYPQGSHSDSSSVLMWYTVRDRRIAAGICERGPVMYVTQIVRI